MARWTRYPNGEWKRKSFRVLDFSIIAPTTIDEDIAKLRAIPGKWKESEDPIKDLEMIRHEDEIH